MWKTDRAPVDTRGARIIEDPAAYFEHARKVARRQIQMSKVDRLNRSVQRKLGRTR